LPSCAACKERYEVHHGVDITDPAIVAAAELSHRYITDRFLPDKAIDLIDEAAAKIKIEMDSKPEVMDKLDRRLIQLQDRARGGQEGKGRGLAEALGADQRGNRQAAEGIADLDEIWKAEKARPRAAPRCGGDRQAQVPDRGAHPQGRLQQGGRAAVRQLPELEKRLKEAQAKEAGKGKAPARQAPQLLRTRSAPRRSPRW
jgi:ATP-dependent Clp protease ATP-binding subunit ClpB